MSKYRFSSEQKFALWRAYGGKCAYCHEPTRLLDVTIDHILPEYLAEKPDELQKLIVRFNLGEDFSINNYCNWAPMHFGCNVKKNATVFESAPYYTGIARSKALIAQEEEQRAIKNREFDKALAVVARGIKQGLASKSQAITFLQSIKQAIIGFYDPIVVTFGMNVSDALDEGLIGEDAPTYYPILCDWLEQELVKRLESTVSCTFYYPEASARNGETLSVRLAFVHLDLNELERFTSNLWEILEVDYHSAIYETLADGTENDLLAKIS
jgi:hypothetical protein